MRPVSARATQELTLAERRYADGSDPCLLDIITIEMHSPQPHHHQQENHLFAARRRWIKQGALDWHALQAAVEDPRGPLWLNGRSSYNGQNDRVPEAALAGLTRSLYLVRPQKLSLVVATEGGHDFDPPKRKLRARFSLSGHCYCMSITDPAAESKYFAGADGEYVVPEALLCVSLSEVYHGYAYKLVASVITP